MFKTITVLDIDFDVDYSTYKVKNDNGVGQNSTYITIESIRLKGDIGYNLEEVLSDHVLQRIEDEIMTYEAIGG